MRADLGRFQRVKRVPWFACGGLPHTGFRDPVTKALELLVYKDLEAYLEWASVARAQAALSTAYVRSCSVIERRN